MLFSWALTSCLWLKYQIRNTFSILHKQHSCSSSVHTSSVSSILFFFHKYITIWYNLFFFLTDYISTLGYELHVGRWCCLIALMISIQYGSHQVVKFKLTKIKNSVTFQELNSQFLSVSKLQVATVYEKNRKYIEHIL